MYLFVTLMVLLTPECYDVLLNVKMYSYLPLMWWCGTTYSECDYVLLLTPEYDGVAVLLTPEYNDVLVLTPECDDMVLLTPECDDVFLLTSECDDVVPLTPECDDVVPQC